MLFCKGTALLFNKYSGNSFVHLASLKSPGYKSSMFHMAQALFELCTHWKNLYIVFLNAFPLPLVFINHIVTCISCLFSKFLSVCSQGKEEGSSVGGGTTTNTMSFPIAMLFKLVQVMEGLQCIRVSALFSDCLYWMFFLKTSAKSIWSPT